jgi:hypothetical protein
MTERLRGRSAPESLLPTLRRIGSAAARILGATPRSVRRGRPAGRCRVAAQFVPKTPECLVRGIAGKVPYSIRSDASMHRSTRLMHATDWCVVNGGSSFEGLTKAVFAV